MNVEELSEKLKEDEDNIVKVLNKLGFDEDRVVLNPYKHLITAPRPFEGADNPKGFILYTDTLRWQYTTRSGKGNLYTLAMELMDWDFPRTLHKIAEWIGFKESKVPVTLPFGGFFKRIVKEDDEYDPAMQTYNEALLPPADSLSQKFLQDGISLQTQEKWGVRYDHITNSILIPIWQNGKLVGCKARNNDSQCDFNHRWWAYLEYNKNQVLFGVQENYIDIIKKDTIIILESEKAPMQAESFGLNCCGAIGGHAISHSQACQIRALGVKKIILAFDEGISEDEIKQQCAALNISTPFYTPEIYYIYDKDHKYLPIGSKNAPTDRGKAVMLGLLKDCLIRYKGTP